MQLREDNVLLKLDQAETATEGGILLPETSQDDETMTGVVLDTGPGFKTQHGNILPMSVSKGDKVILPKWAGQEITIDKEKYLIVSERYILGVVGG